MEFRELSWEDVEFKLVNLKIWLEMFLRHKRRTVNYYLRIFTNSVGKYNSRIEEYLIITIVQIRIPIIILLLLILYILYCTILYTICIICNNIIILIIYYINSIVYIIYTLEFRELSHESGQFELNQFGD